MNALFGPTGGISYHAAALQYKRSLWRPFITDVNDWLCNVWSPKQKELIIFGTSAGWTLEPRFLNRFERIICVEPDPLARALFRLRFAADCRAKIIFAGSRTTLPWFSAAPGEFALFLSLHHNAAVLFSNLLGQIPLLLSASARSQQPEFREEFLLALRGRSWASYHDLLSSRAPLAGRAGAIVGGAGWVDALAERVFSPAVDDLTVTDHDTTWLGLPDHVSIWRLRRDVSHVVGFCLGEDALPGQS